MESRCYSQVFNLTLNNFYSKTHKNSKILNYITIIMGCLCVVIPENINILTDIIAEKNSMFNNFFQNLEIAFYFLRILVF